MNFIISIIIAGGAGWFAGRLMSGEYGAILNIVLGLVGGAVGSFIFSLLGFKSSGGLIPQIIISVIGAVLVIWLYRKFVKK
ncbi:MAG: GlsB/YeaQ/YmgE family stress response membrane protein [Bacteroidia bacterium]|nr:GlsB/YeaQ/YmgE family stress response membrane protein [Bacteroidia bacterium]